VSATSEPARALLQRRAALLSAPLQETVLSVGLTQLVTFSLAGGRYGVEDVHVRGAARLGRVTLVPGAPVAIVGITMHLGDLLMVADLRVLLGMAPAVLGAGDALLILADGRGQLGIVVEDFGDMAMIGAGATASTASSETGNGMDLIQGVTPDGIAVINLAGLLAHPDLSPRVARASS